MSFLISVSKKVVTNVSRSMYQRHKLQNARHISVTAMHHEKIAFKISNEAKITSFESAIINAENIVGYQSSYLTLRHLLSDEMSNLGPHMRQFVSSGHPLVDTCKTLMCGKSNKQTWGLIVLMLSKIAGSTLPSKDDDEDTISGVLNSQRVLSESTEMIRTAFLIHDGIINLQSLPNAGNDLNGDGQMIVGNKVAVLGGDYLQGLAAAKIAKLKNYELFNLIATAGRDINDGHFVGDRDDQNNPIPSDPAKRVSSDIDMTTDDDCIDNTLPFDVTNAMGRPDTEWEVRHFLSDGSLLSKSCQGTLLIAGHSKEIQTQGYLMGKHLALAWQAFIDLEPFKSNKLPSDSRFSLISAPVLFHLDHDPTLYKEIKKASDSINDVDYQLLHREIMKGPGIEKTRELQGKHSLKAMTELYKFPESDCRTALENIILAMQED